MANMKLLTADSYPNSNFKLSTVGKKTIEVHDSFIDSKLGAVMNRYEAVSDSLRSLSNQMTSDASKYKNKLDAKKIQALKNLAAAMKKQASACDSRRKAMKTSATKDVKALKAALETQAWQTAIAYITNEVDLSAEARAALEDLSKYL